MSSALADSLKDFIVGLAHVGFIVPDIEQALAEMTALYGLTEDDVRRLPESPDASADTLFAFVSIADCEFELIEVNSERFRTVLSGSPVGGAGINHVAWQVSDLESALGALASRGIRPGHVTPDGIVDFGAKRLVYLDPEDTGGQLVELIEIRA